MKNADIKADVQGEDIVLRLLESVIKNPVFELLALIAALERMQDASIVSPVMKDIVGASGASIILAQQMAPLVPYMADTASKLLNPSSIASLAALGAAG